MDVPPIYCINIASNTGRRRRMESRFEFHGLDGSVRFIDAFTPEHPDVQLIRSDLRQTNLREVACVIIANLAAALAGRGARRGNPAAGLITR